MWLKVEGVCECGELLVVVFVDGCECYVFGCCMLLEMDLVFVVCVI